MYKLVFILLTIFVYCSSTAQTCDTDKQLLEIEAIYSSGHYTNGIDLIETVENCPQISTKQYQKLLHLKYKCLRNLRKGKKSLAVIEELRHYHEVNNTPLNFETQLLLAEAYALRGKREEHQRFIKIIEDSLSSSTVVGDTAMGKFLLVQYYGYEKEGIYGDAITIAQKALAHFQKLETPPVYYLGNTLRALGNMNRNSGDYHKSIAYYQQELELYESNFEPDHFDIAVCHYNLGGIFYHQLAYQTALDHYLKAHTTWSKVYQPKNRYMKMLNEAIGDMYWELDDHEKALNYFNASVIDDPVVDNDSSKTTLKIADSILKRGNYSSAMDYYQEAFKWREKTFGKEHILTGSCKNFVARAKGASGDTMAALIAYQEAIGILVDEMDGTNIYKNPTAKMRIRSHQYLLESLSAKGQLLGTLYLTTNDSKDLLASFQTYEVGIEILETMKKRHMSETSKIFWTQHTRTLIENAIETARQLYLKTGQIDYLERAFIFSEKSKALLLLASFENSNNQSFANVPSSILTKEKNLKSDITIYLGKLESEEKRCADVRIKMLKLYQKKLQSLQNQYDLLLLEIKTKYPNYYNLKYETTIAPIQEVRTRLLNNQTGLISYFMGLKRAYVFHITEDDISIRKLENTEDLNKQAISFFTLLHSKENLESNPQEAFTQYISLSYQLYETLLQPEREAHKYSNLLIIPDGLLSYVPFDMLLTRPITSVERDYKNLPYVLKDCGISYAPSATVQVRSNDHSTTSNDYIGFAPSYQDAFYSEEKKKLTHLEYNASEVNFAATLFNGTSWTGNEVTENIIKAHSSKAGILHLAMHGEVEDTHPLLSKLYFSPSKQEDGMLHTYEIYNLNIPSQLVILSACNTAKGKLEYGEGILSLERAFQYAGSKALLASLWTVDDASSAELTQNFLINLKGGQPKGIALQQAKLKFLATAPPNKTHPYYWGSFRLTGNTQKLSEKKNLLWYIIGIPISFLLLFLFYRKAKPLIVNSQV